MKLIIDHLIQLEKQEVEFMLRMHEGDSNYNEKMIPMKDHRAVLVTQRKHK